MSAPYFWHQPFRYLRYASHTKPALFWSVVLGTTGPVIFAGSIPVKRVLGIENRPKVPATYPGMWSPEATWPGGMLTLCFVFCVVVVPNRPRLIPVGYDDPE